MIEHPGNDTNTRVALVSPYLEFAWKLGLFTSVVLYIVGLLISNYRLQHFGFHTPELAKAEYILVGFVWAALTYIGYLLNGIIRELWHNRPKTSQSHLVRTRLQQAFSLAITVLVAGLLFGILTTALGVGGLLRLRTWLLYGYALFAGAAFQSFIRRTQDVMQNERLGFSMVLKPWILPHITRHGYWAASTLVIYAVMIFPAIPATLGGGKFHQAEIFIKADVRDLLSQQADLTPDARGSLGPWSLVAEMSDAIIITDEPAHLGKSGTTNHTLWLRKDFISTIKYLHED